MIWITNDAFHWDEKEESPLHPSHVVGKQGEWVAIYTGKPFDPAKNMFDKEVEDKFNAFGVYVKDSEHSLIDHSRPYVFIDAIAKNHAKNLTPKLMKELRDKMEDYEDDFVCVRVRANIVCHVKRLDTKDSTCEV